MVVVVWPGVAWTGAAAAQRRRGIAAAVARRTVARPSRVALRPGLEGAGRRRLTSEGVRAPCGLVARGRDHHLDRLSSG
jgi:hypothetical protein